MDQFDSAPGSWISALERGRADIAAGRVSNLETYLRELLADDEAEGDTAAEMHTSPASAGTR